RLDYPFDGRAVRDRLQPLSQRVAGHLLPHRELNLLGDVLLSGEVGRVEPGRAQVLHALAREPAEPALLAGAADRRMRTGIDEVEAFPTRAEGAPAPFVDRVLVVAALNHGAPVHALKIDVHAKLLQEIGPDLALSVEDRIVGRRDEDDLLALVT